MDKLLPCLIVIFMLLLSLTVILLAASMDSIEPLEIGIKYNRLTRSVDGQVYDSGRYIIGPLYMFITYPANLVNIEFSDSRKAIVYSINLERTFANQDS